MRRKGLNQVAQSSSPKWAKVASAVTLALAVPAANAVGISWGEWEGSFDTTLSVGASWRMENQNGALIGLGKEGDNGVQGMAYSHNGDDGNLNFHKGDTFSEIFKGVHEFGLTHSSGFGFFIRGTWFYDKKLKDGDFRYYGTVDQNSRSQVQTDLYGYADYPVNGFSDAALDQQGSDIQLLDAYIYNTWYFDESALQVRVGEQVVNWGESTFIQHSISEANPIDVTKLRVPGAELKEAFIPVQTLWASVDLTPNVTLEGYVQFEWEGIRIDEPGTYFSSQDFLGESGKLIWLGFGLAPEFTPGAAAFRSANDSVSDNGQFGIKLGWYAEELGDTEFGFYYLNYHNKRPIISARKYDQNLGGVTGYLDYVENIQLYGISFNTATDAGLSVAGEVSYRVDEPLQIDDVELLFAALGGVSPSVPRGTSQLNDSLAAGETISGYQLFDTIQGQVTLTNLFGPGLGASQWTGLMEIGFNQIEDMPDQDVLRFEAPGTYRSGNPNRAQSNGFEGVETNDFADDFSWGYRLVVKADYTGVIGAWNMSPRLIFQHDVSGTTPAPISNFIEGRKAIALGATFDYLQKWKVDVAYNQYSGGGTANLISDRDFIALTASYSF